jgi:hypothetical protein
MAKIFLIMDAEVQAAFNIGYLYYLTCDLTIAVYEIISDKFRQKFMFNCRVFGVVLLYFYTNHLFWVLFPITQWDTKWQLQLIVIH